MRVTCGRRVWSPTTTSLMQAFLVLRPSRRSSWTRSSASCSRWRGRRSNDRGTARPRIPGLIGLYAGTDWNRYARHCVWRRPDLLERYGETNTAMLNEFDFLTTRVSYKLNLRGPSVNMSTACSTSLVAVAQAAQGLLGYDCDIALAGGISISVPINAGYLYQEGGMLSADGHCRTFDATSTGTTFNDGATLVVLRRLEDAVKDGDKIYAVLRGFAINNDGSDKVSYTAPSVSGQSDVIRSAIDFADIDPGTIGYVEAHGTATPLGRSDRNCCVEKSVRGHVERERH